MKKIILLTVLISSTFAFSQSISDDPLIFLNSGRIDKAKSILTEKLTNNNTDVRSIELLGDIASFEKKWDLAISFYKKLIVAHPENSGFNLKYGGALGMKALSVSRFQALVYIPDIKKYLELAANQDRRQIESRRALVELYIQLPGILGGSEEKAVEYAEQLISLSPVNAYLAKGFIIEETKNIEKALVYYKLALKKHKETNKYLDLNSLNYELGKVSAEFNLEPRYGVELLDKYIKNYSYKDIYSMEWVYLRKAQIMANLNNKKEAIKYIDKALTLKGDFKEALRERERIQAL